MYVLPKFLGAENRLYIYICRNAATCLAVNEGICGSVGTLLFLFYGVSFSVQMFDLGFQSGVLLVAWSELKLLPLPLKVL